MLVLELDKQFCRTMLLPGRVLSTRPTAGIRIGNSWILGEDALSYGYERDQGALRYFLEDEPDEAGLHGLDALLQELLATIHSRDAYVLFPQGIEDRLLARAAAVVRRIGHTWTGAMTSVEFWVRALDLEPGRYAFLSGGYRSGCCAIVEAREQEVVHTGLRHLPSWGVEAAQRSIEPLVREVLVSATRLDPLTEPKSARRFYGEVNRLLGEITKDVEGWTLVWGKERVHLNFEKSLHALDTLEQQARLELGDALLELQPRLILLLPSAQLPFFSTLPLALGQSTVDFISCGIRSVNDQAVRRVESHMMKGEPPRETRLQQADAVSRRPLPRRLTLAAVVLGLVGLVGYSLTKVGSSRAPGIYLVHELPRGSKLSAHDLKAVGAVSDRDTRYPTETWHVEGAYLLRDLTPDSIVEWRYLSADPPSK